MGKTRALRKYRRKSKQVKKHIKPFSKKFRKRSTNHKKNKHTVKRRQGVKYRRSRRIMRGGVDTEQTVHTVQKMQKANAEEQKLHSARTEWRTELIRTKELWESEGVYHDLENSYQAVNDWLEKNPDNLSIFPTISIEAKVKHDGRVTISGWKYSDNNYRINPILNVTGDINYRDLLLRAKVFKIEIYDIEKNSSEEYFKPDNLYARLERKLDRVKLILNLNNSRPGAFVSREEQTIEKDLTKLAGNGTPHVGFHEFIKIYFR